MSTFVSNSWSIRLPPDWIGEDEEDCATIYHPNGVGALQVSSYLKESEVNQSDLADLAQEHIDSRAKLTDALSGDFVGFTLCFGLDGNFWQSWYVAKNTIALLITYNCDEVDVGPERDQVKQMVASLQAV